MHLNLFNEYLKCGLGRCFEILSDCADREPYRPSVLDICLNNPSFDTQSEGTRAEYVYRLVSLFGDDEYFVTPVIQKLWTVLDDSGWDFAHLYDLAEQFAVNGNESAENALREAYGRLYGILLDRTHLDDYDGARDAFERVCVSFANRYGAPAYERIIADMGNLFLKNSRYGADDFDWFFFCYNEHMGMCSNGIPKTTCDTSSATAPERRQTDEGAEEKEKERERAIKMLAVGENVGEAVGKLVRNYRPCDKEILIDSLNKMEIDADEESGWHSAFIEILNGFDRGAKLPRETLEFIYEHSLCSCCRENAVRSMDKRGWLTDEIKRECLYDSNPDTVSYVKRFLKATT